MGRAALIIVLGFTVVFTSAWFNMNRATQEASDALVHHYTEAVARNAARSACLRALNERWRNPSWTGDYTGASLGGAGYEMRFLEPTEAEPDLPPRTYRLEATSWYSGDTARVWVRFEEPSLAEFAWFTDSEEGVFFQTGDLIRGPAHTNGYFSIDGAPVFEGDVSSALTARDFGHEDGWAELPGHEATPDFQGETTFGRPRIDFPDAADINSIRELARTGSLARPAGYCFNQEIWVQLGVPNAASPSMNMLKIRTTDPGIPNGRSAGFLTTHWLPRYPATIPPSPGPPFDPATTLALRYVDMPNRILATEDGMDIHLWGKLRTDQQGLTIVSGRDIIIEADVLYENEAATSNDLLGLIAKRHVEIAWNEATMTTDPNDLDCHVDAAILALGSFRAEDHDEPIASPHSRGTLYVLGAVIQRQRGEIGTPDPTGYYKDYEYDSRLMTRLPPSFPLSGEIHVLAWHE